METVTAFLEEQGDTCMVFWSHLQKLKSDRGPYRHESHSSLQSWRDRGPQEAQTDEDRMGLQIRLYLFCGEQQGPEFSPRHSVLHFSFPWPPQHHCCPHTSQTLCGFWNLHQRATSTCDLFPLSVFFFFFYLLALLCDSSPEIPSLFLNDSHPKGPGLIQALEVLEPYMSVTSPSSSPRPRS